VPVKEERKLRPMVEGNADCAFRVAYDARLTGDVLITDAVGPPSCERFLAAGHDVGRPVLEN
jgi:hypothetical protein